MAQVDEAVKTEAWIIATRPCPEKAAMEKFFLIEEEADVRLLELNDISIGWGGNGNWKKFRILIEVCDD